MVRKKADEGGFNTKAKPSGKEKLSVSAMLASMDSKPEKPKKGLSLTSAKPKSKTAPNLNNDECGFTLVNLNKRGHRNDKFVLASQVSQVFYIDDPFNKGWSIVLPVPNRCYEGEDDDWTSIPESRPIDGVDTHCIPVHERYFRSENEGVWVINKRK